MKFPRNIRLAILPLLDIFQINTSVKDSVQIIGGYESRFLDLLSDALQFNSILQVPSDLEWGRRLEGNKWTGLIGLVVRNETDMALGNIGITYDRTNVVDFSYPYLFDYVKFVTKTPGYVSKETALFHPFTLNVWLCLFLSIILVAILCRVLLRKKYSFQIIFLYIIGIILNQGKKIEVKNTKHIVLICSWFFGAVFLSYSYTAVLLSFMTVPLRENPIDNKRQLLDAITYKNYECSVLSGSAILNIIRSGAGETDANLAKVIEENNWNIEPKAKILGKYLEKGKTAVIGIESDFDMLHHDRIHFADESFDVIFSGIVVSKHFCCKEALDLVVHRVSAGGFYDKIREDFLFRSQLKYRILPSLEPQGWKALSVSDLSGAFIILMLGNAVSFIICMLEVAVLKLKLL